MVVEQWHQQNRGWEVQQRTDNRNIHLQANNLEELEPVDVCRHATDEQAESVQAHSPTGMLVESMGTPGIITSDSTKSK